MINVEIKNRRIEITYDTGLELKFITYLLKLIEMYNEVKE